MKRILPTLALLMFLLMACDDRPKDVLSRGKMEDVLYDYHIMQGIIDELPSEEREAKAQDYINAVFEKLTNFFRIVCSKEIDLYAGVL